MKKTPKNKTHLKRKPKKKQKRYNRLERTTASYFALLSPEALEEENRLGAALAHAASQVDFDAYY